MTSETWINENCKSKDWSEEANQVKDFIHASDVFDYMEKYAEKKLDEYKSSQEKEVFVFHYDGEILFVSNDESIVKENEESGAICDKVKFVSKK